MTKLERFTTRVTTRSILSDFGLRRPDFYVKSADAVMTPATPAPEAPRPSETPAQGNGSRSSNGDAPHGTR
jgi:hypothetical protein